MPATWNAGSHGVYWQFVHDIRPDNGVLEQYMHGRPIFQHYFLNDVCALNVDASQLPRSDVPPFHDRRDVVPET